MGLAAGGRVRGGVIVGGRVGVTVGGVGVTVTGRVKTVYPTVGILSSSCTHFQHFYQPFNMCTSIWVTHDVCFLCYSLFEVWAAFC